MRSRGVVIRVPKMEKDRLWGTKSVFFRRKEIRVFVTLTLSHSNVRAKSIIFSINRYPNKIRAFFYTLPPAPIVTRYNFLYNYLRWVQKF